MLQDADGIVKVFDMMIERLSDLEKVTRQLKDHAKHCERTKVGRLDNQLFDIPFSVIRESWDYDGRTDSSASLYTRAVYISCLNGECLPTWPYTNDVRDNIRKLAAQRLPGVDIEAYISIEADADESIKCADPMVNISSPYRYLSEHIGQKYLEEFCPDLDRPYIGENHYMKKLGTGKNARLEGCLLDEFGLLMWSTKDLMIDDWIEICRGCLKILGKELKRTDVMCVYDVSLQAANFYNLWFWHKTGPMTDRLKREMIKYKRGYRRGLHTELKMHPILCDHDDEYDEFLERC